MSGTRRVRRDAAQSPLGAYLLDIKDIPLLRAEEEVELARRIAGGDAEARDHLVRANLRLVVSIARAYAGRGLSLPDLVAEGNLGLLRAAEGFDPDLGCRFGTYAGLWIKQSIKRALVNTAKTVRLPAHLENLLTKWHRARAALQKERGTPPADEEVARLLGLSRRKLSVIRKALRLHKAGPGPGGDDEAPSIDATLPDGHSRPPDAALADSEELGRLVRLVDGMDPRAARVLRLRFGLDGQEPLTLKEVGERLGVTRERVRQIEREALAGLAEIVQPA